MSHNFSTEYHISSSNTYHTKIIALIEIGQTLTLETIRKELAIKTALALCQNLDSINYRHTPSHGVLTSKIKGSLPLYIEHTHPQIGHNNIHIPELLNYGIL